MKYANAVAAARARAADMDRSDRASGFAAPADYSPLLQVRTALAAIECAITVEDWGAVAEAAVLLEDLQVRMKKEGAIQ